MLTLLYVMTVLVVILPWSYLVRWIGINKLKVLEVVREMRVIEKEYAGLKPQEKKAKILEERSSKLKRKLSSFFIVNLLALWGGVFMAMVISEYMYLLFILTYGGGRAIPSPLSLPVVSSSGGSLNELLIFLATIIGYQSIHNKITGVDALRG